MRGSSLEKDPSRLEPEGDDADRTGLGESWARGVLTMRGSKASEGRREGREEARRLMRAWTWREMLGSGR